MIAVYQQQNHTSYKNWKYKHKLIVIKVILITESTSGINKATRKRVFNFASYCKCSLLVWRSKSDSAIVDRYAFVEKIMFEPVYL